MWRTKCSPCHVFSGSWWLERARKKKTYKQLDNTRVYCKVLPNIIPYYKVPLRTTTCYSGRYPHVLLSMLQTRSEVWRSHAEKAALFMARTGTKWSKLWTIWETRSGYFVHFFFSPRAFLTAECLVARTVLLVSLQALGTMLAIYIPAAPGCAEERAKSKPVSLGGGWKPGVVGRAGDLSEDLTDGRGQIQNFPNSSISIIHWSASVATLKPIIPTFDSRELLIFACPIHCWASHGSSSNRLPMQHSTCPAFTWNAHDVASKVPLLRSAGFSPRFHVAYLNLFSHTLTPNMLNFVPWILPANPAWSSNHHRIVRRKWTSNFSISAIRIHRGPAPKQAIGVTMASKKFLSMQLRCSATHNWVSRSGVPSRAVLLNATFMLQTKMQDCKALKILRSPM